MPRPTAQVEPFVTVLGADLAVQFLLNFGGSELSLSSDPKGRGAVEHLVGYEKARELGAVILQRRIPLAKPWLTEMLHWQGMSANEIARRLRTTDVTVRAYLRKGKAR